MEVKPVTYHTIAKSTACKFLHPWFLTHSILRSFAPGFCTDRPQFTTLLGLATSQNVSQMIHGAEQEYALETSTDASFAKTPLGRVFRGFCRWLPPVKVLLTLYMFGIRPSLHCILIPESCFDSVPVWVPHFSETLKTSCHDKS